MLLAGFGFFKTLLFRGILWLKRGDLSRSASIADEYWNGKPHTREGHRIQSVIEARHLEATYKDKGLYIRVYKYLGDLTIVSKLDWASTGFDMTKVDPGNLESYPDLWAILHDTPFFTNEKFNYEAVDYSNPYFISSLRPLLPGLSGWK